MKVLVVTLHSGEAEFDRCVSSVEVQAGVDVEHVVFSDLPNLEAHRRCYDTIQTHRGFHVAVKLDADMVLRSPTVLHTVAGLFADDPTLDHAQLPLHDFYSDRPIMGMQAFSPRARWHALPDSLFVDPAPVVPGRRCDYWRIRPPVADHSPDPSPLQAFRFGVHHALKAFQPDRSRVRGHQARDQWRVLVHTWQAFVRTEDVRRGLAVLGADLVWRGALTLGEAGYRISDAEAALDRAPKDAEGLLHLLSPRWGRSARREARRLLSLGPSGSARAAAASGKALGERIRGGRGSAG